jgi:diguanylate cyclase (GGDEF)-like protein
MSTSGVAAPLTRGRPRDPGRHHLSRSLTPYRILAAIQVAAATLALVFALLPGVSDSAAANLPLTMAAALLATAVVTRFAMPLLPRDLGIDVGLAIGYGLAAIAAWATPTGEGQCLIGLGLICYAVIAAYFLPSARIPVSLFVMLGFFGTAVRLHMHMSSAAVFYMIVVVISGMTLLVHRLVVRLRDLAMHDELTTLLNRRGLDLLAPPVLAACARSGTPVTVGIIDLDQFKLYNDTHGHLAGDRLLQHVAQGWRDELRDSDLCARFGGDEFALVLVDSGLNDARALEARVRAACPETRGSDSSGWTVGWAEVASQEYLYSALERADSLLFDAKRSRGANRR